MQSIDEIIARHNRLKSNRSTFEWHWQEVLTFCNPRKATVTTRGMPGAKRMSQVFDGTAISANDILAAGMNTFLTSQTTRWFQLETEDMDLMESDEVTAWLQDVERRMYRMFRKSNFYSAIHETYLDDGSIGTSILYTEEDFDDICRFLACHIGECCIAEDNKGRVDTLFRELHYTARQAKQEWGDAAGDEVKKALPKEPDKPMTFLHAVMPREERDSRKKDKLSLPWASLYIEPKKKRLISEGGYHEFCYQVNRWTRDTGEVYGRSPAMNALADTKMVNQMDKTMIKVGQKILDPPLILPDDGMIGTVKLVPGGLNYVRADMLERNIEPKPMKLGGNFRPSLEIANQKREAIRKFFFVDLFLLLMNRPTMTATEVLERNEEKVAILGPTLGRVMSEKLNPVIGRSYGIMSRGNLLPPPPAILEGQKLSIRYVSMLAKIQELYETKNIQGTLQEVGTAAGAMPEIWDNVDPDGLFDEIADRHGFPQKARRTVDRVKSIREGRQQAAQEETEKEDITSGAGVLSQAAKAGLIEAGSVE